MGPRRVDAQRVVWTVLVAAFLALAVAAPVEMIQAAQPSDGGAEDGAADESEGRAEVSMVAISFRPDELAVRPGTEVIFTNDDLAPHTVTAANGGPIDSGTLGPGKVYSLVINEPLEYVCLIHPSMKGKVLLTG